MLARGTPISRRLVGRCPSRRPQIAKPPRRAARGLGGTLGHHSGRIRRSLRPKSSMRTALGLGRPVVPVDWRLEVQLAGACLACLSSGQLGQLARELSRLVLSSPPWPRRQPVRQTTGTKGRPRPTAGRVQLFGRRERRIRPLWRLKVENEPRRPAGPRRHLRRSFGAVAH